MEKSYWNSRWHKGKIGFHSSQADDALISWWPKISEGIDANVLVPLCGKSPDLHFLAGLGHGVIGVEFIRQACAEFFEEADIEPEIRQKGRIEIFESDPYKILCGDWFHISKKHTGNAKLLYDRAALVALPPEDRKTYMQHSLSVMPETCSMLIVTFEYDQNVMSGPPFSVPPAEVMEGYGSAAEVELLETKDLIHDYEKFRNKGLDRFLKHVFWVRR